VSRTTIARDLIDAIRLGTADKERILHDLEEASRGSRELHVGRPAVTVSVHEIQGPSLARGTGYVSDSPPYRVVHTASLYEMSDAARVDVLRIGRQPGQDVELLDRCVSREHGLIIYADGLPLFCDYGTLHDGSHTGSTNGTYLDGVTRIRDAMITWMPAQALMLGTTSGPRNLTFRYKVTYDLLGFTSPPDTDVN